MAAAWDRGARRTAAEILDLHPDLDTETAIRLIYEEVCLRREAGLEVDTDALLRRYPRWRDSLQDLLDCDRLLSPSGALADCPDVGETLGPFRLLAELGRGGSGRAYLAAEPSLADRPVVLKVIPGDQDEHLALARLRHAHIVPLFSEHFFPDRNLRVLCMPYLGGASLAQIVKELADVPPSRRSGKLLVTLLDRNTRTTPAPFRPDGPFRARRPSRSARTARSGAAWKTRRTRRQSPGSWPALPMRSITPTHTALSTWTSIRRMS
jgi:hypothetical protein